MSHSESRRGSEGNRLGGFDVETVDGTASVDVIGEPGAPKRVDVDLEDGPEWIFGVNEGAAALALVLDQNGNRSDAEIPYWIEPIIQRTGLEGVEQ